MTDSAVLQGLFAQAWQLAALVLLVAIGIRLTARNRPHLAHALWLVVLLKCVTPPVLHSPIGLFSWLSPGVENSTYDAATHTLANHVGYAATSNVGGENGALGPADVTAIARPAHELAVESAASENLSAITANGISAFAGGSRLTRAMLVVWGLGVVVMTVVAAGRVALCWRRLRASQVEAHPELEALIAQLRKRLRVRRAVRLLVTNSRIGPAVIGLLRPTILLPACVVRGRASSELEPIVAHELIHIRRGDLWVGLLQTVAQIVSWFHPLVWLTSRMISREAERCCDEEVIGELRCEPSRYARSLLGVLEWKRFLIPAPAVPGVRAVEITSKRLERIMTLGQGCRRRTPWWCWATMLLVAVVALPGAALRLQGEEPASENEPATRADANDQAEAAPKQNVPTPIEYPQELSVLPKEVDKMLSYGAEWGIDLNLGVSPFGRPLQVWGVGDLLAAIEEQCHLDHADAKKYLWARLVCEKANAEAAEKAAALGADAAEPLAAPPATLDPQAAQSSEASDNAEQATDPERKPFWCGDKLVMSEDSLPAYRTKAAIEWFRKFGFAAIDIEVRFITAPLEMITAVSNRWTTLPMKRAVAGKDLDVTKAPQFDPSVGGVASFSLEKNLPVIFDLLSEAKVKTLMDSLSADRRVQLLQAPRLRVHNGQTATVLDQTQTPFVVGLQNDKPQISIVSTGTTVRTRSVLHGEQAELNVEIVFEGIRSVEDISIQSRDGKPIKIQVPEIAQARIAAMVDVPLGQTVLIAGATAVGDAKASSPMAVLLTVKKADTDHAAAIQDDAKANTRDSAMRESDDQADVPEYTILGPVTCGAEVEVLDPPTPDEVLRALVKKKTDNSGNTNSPWRTAETQRRNTRVQLERLASYIDPPRDYPLYGRAQLHHARYKCTVNFQETVRIGWPLPHERREEDKQEVVYIDHNHLHITTQPDNAHQLTPVSETFTFFVGQRR